jgi:hypothetical protein
VHDDAECDTTSSTETQSNSLLLQQAVTLLQTSDYVDSTSVFSDTGDMQIEDSNMLSPEQRTDVALSYLLAVKVCASSCTCILCVSA